MFDSMPSHIRLIWHMRCNVFDIARTLIFCRFDWELPNSWTNKKILINPSKYFPAKNRYCLCQSTNFVWYMEFTCDVASCPLICPQNSIFIECLRGKDILIYVLFLAIMFDLTQHQIFFSLITDDTICVQSIFVHLMWLCFFMFQRTFNFAATRRLKIRI